MVSGESPAWSSTSRSASAGVIGRRWTVPPSARTTSASQCGGYGAGSTEPANGPVLVTALTRQTPGPGRATARPLAGWRSQPDPADCPHPPCLLYTSDAADEEDSV